MADIFLSYAKPDLLRAMQLSALLESAGYSTWWDHRLQAGDGFRDEITRQLDSSRLALVLWSTSSIASNWVRAEAGRALKQGKLIPLKLDSLSAESVPLPFGELNMIDLADEETLLSEVRRLLAGTLKPPSLRTFTAKFRHSFLYWAGIVGGAITLATNLNGVLRLSELLRGILHHWAELLRFAWRALTLFQIQVSSYDAVYLTLITIFAMSMWHSTRSNGNRTGWKRTLLMSTFSVIVMVVALSAGISGVDAKEQAQADSSFDETIDQLFTQDSACREFMKGYLRNIDNLGITVPREEFASSPSERAKAEECIARSGRQANDIYMYAFGTFFLASDEKERSVVRHVAQRLPEGFAILIVLLGPALLPFVGYLLVRPFVSHRVNASLLARRIFHIAALVIVLVAVDSVLTHVGTIDWSMLIDEK